MSNLIFRFPPFPRRSTGWVFVMLAGVSLPSLALSAGQPTVVPGYVAPLTQTPVAAYVDDTRGVYVPEHEQLRNKTDAELAGWNQDMVSQSNRPMYAQKNPGGQQYEQALNKVANGVEDTNTELDRIGRDPGLLEGGRPSADAGLSDDQSFNNVQMAQNTVAPARAPRAAAGSPDLSQFPSLATGGKPHVTTAASDLGAAGAPVSVAPGNSRDDGGVELAVGGQTAKGEVDLQHSVVRLKEERISVRRALQRMLDQIGGGSWSVVWDLDEVNAGLPDMEISIYAEEPFVKVLNALLARLQTRSGQPLRVIKYDKTQRLVITDRTGGDARSASIGAGEGKGADVAVTESVLKEAKVSLHYDEVPLVDALENIVNQAGKGQWRLRMYAGTDQVLKPAHVEEPFGVAVERILKVFNLRYEIFPGGKLIVVTGGDKFGFRGVE